jgi:hypothetical protein
MARVPPTESAWSVRYEFTLPEKKSVEFTVDLDPKTLRNLAVPPAPKDWARLEFEQCPNCPLTPKDCASCPVALQLSALVAEFAQVFSYEKLSARVTVPERTYLAENISAQAALSSLLGVYMVTSGCPVLSKLRPMVRLHLPFAGELETIARSTSMYLLGQYFVMKRGGTPDWTLDELAETYRQASKVNRAFAKRLRAAAPKDANVNALIILHSFAETVPATIEDQLEELKFLFTQ